MSHCEVVFVTVGTTWFDELVEAVDQCIERGILDKNVVFQIGLGKYIPRFGRYFRTAAGLSDYYRAARLVIGHGGTGTVLEALDFGVPFVGVANPMMKDDHQSEFLEMLDDCGLIVYCRDIARLDGAILRAFQIGPDAKRSLFDNNAVAIGLREKWAACHSPKPKPLWWARLLMRICNIRVPLETIDIRRRRT